MQRTLERDADGGRRAASADAFLPLFAYGFRPFFLGAGVFAVLAMVLWIGWLAGLWPLGRGYGALSWHAHEMIFGYAAAVVAGFLLTAVPNWTGRLPVAGAPLVFLFLLWCAGRIAFVVTGLLGPWPAVVLDSLFLPCLFLVAAREVVAGRNWRNLRPLVLVAALGAANIGFHAEVMATGSPAIASRAAIAALIALIMLIGGRIVPSFTHSFLSRQKSMRLPIAFNRFDLVSVAVSAMALILWVVRPEAPTTGVSFLVAALVQFARVSRWAGLYAWREPLVLVLHLGYVFVPLGFLLGGIAILVPHTLAGTAPMHAWTIGAIGVMTLAVMTRASRGHTGRTLAASKLTMIIYASVIAAALLRIAAGAVPNVSSGLIELAGIAWIAGFTLFVFEYAPMLLKARLEED